MASLQSQYEHLAMSIKINRKLKNHILVDLKRKLAPPGYLYKNQALHLQGLISRNATLLKKIV